MKRNAVIFLEVIFFGVFFGQVWGNLGKNPLHPQKFACSYTFVYDIKFGMLQVRENEIALRKWFGGTVHLRTLEGTCGTPMRRLTELIKVVRMSKIE